MSRVVGSTLVYINVFHIQSTCNRKQNGVRVPMTILSDWFPNSFKVMNVPSPAGPTTHMY